MSTLQKIQQQIVDRDYFMSSQTEEEMLDDDLERNDVENAGLVLISAISGYEI